MGVKSQRTYHKESLKLYKEGKIKASIKPLNLITVN